MPGEISIVLVDDHTIVRNGLRTLIEALGNYKVIAQYDNGKHFIDAPSILQEPDLVVMDLNMPEMDGAQTMTWLRQHRPDMKVLVLTLNTEEKTILELFRLGVRGYLPKNCTADVLKKAIEDTVYSGYYHSDLLQHALASEADKQDDKATIQARISDREMLFVTLVCHPDEYTYEQIANKMTVSRRTVDGYREELFEKFHIRSKTGLVMFAIKHGLVTL